MGPGPGRRPGAPGPVGRPDRPARGPGRAGRGHGCARCWPGAARTRSRSAAGPAVVAPAADPRPPHPRRRRRPWRRGARCWSPAGPARSAGTWPAGWPAAAPPGGAGLAGPARPRPVPRRWPRRWPRPAPRCRSSPATRPTAPGWPGCSTGSGSGPALTAVFHAAGATDDGVLDRLGRRRRLPAVLAAKAAGAALPRRADRRADLDAFVLFSSVAATSAARGQGNYAAANAYLDALAAARRARGLAGDLGGLGPVGRRRAWPRPATRSGRGCAAARLPRDGPRPGDPGAGAGRSTAGTSRARGRWTWTGPGSRRRSAAPRREPAAARPARQPAAARGRRAATRRAGGRAGRAAGRPARGRAGAAADRPGPRARPPRCSATPRADAVEPGRAFSDLGFDSLTAVELRNRLSAVDRPAAARHAGLRLPHAGGAGRVPAGAAGRGRAGRRPRRSAAAAAAVDEPVAIVGMGCRFPGGVRQPGGLWELLAAGDRRDLGVPRRPRLGRRGLYEPDPASRALVRARRAASWRRGRVRRRVLRDQPAGGAGDGPAAAAAARGVLGGAGAGRDRPGVAARLAGPACSPGRSGQDYADGLRRRAEAAGRATC